MAKQDKQDEVQQVTNRHVLAGNRMSLRTKPWDAVRRLPVIKDIPGIGDFMVTTWLTILLAVITLLVIFGLFYGSIQKAMGYGAWGQLLPYIGLIIVGTLILAVEVLLVNPSQGLQIGQVIKYIVNWISRQRSSESDNKIDNYSFYDNDPKSNILINIENGRAREYTMGYKVHGSISRLSFSTDLDRVDYLMRQTLRGIKRRSKLATVNMVNNASVELPPLPVGATEAMQLKNQMNYNIVADLKNNQQIDTYVFLTSPDLPTLDEANRALVRAFNSGMVVSSEPLRGAQLKKGVRQLYV